MVMVFPLEGNGVGLDGNTAVSCAKGKLLIAGVPPFVKDHLAFPDPHVSPIDWPHHTVLAASNVIPLLPLQSPNRVPDAGAAAPAMVMSRKSTSVSDTAAQVRVRVVPRVLDCTKCRIVALVPADSVSVPVTVWLADREITFRPAEVIPVNDRLLKLLAPLIVTVPDEVFVKSTL